MALHTTPAPTISKPLTLDDYQPSVLEHMGLMFDYAFESNPVPSLMRAVDMSGWERGAFLTDDGPIDPTVDIDFEDYRRQREAESVPLEEQEKKFEEAGLKGQLKAQAGLNAEALNIIIENKQLENALDFTGSKTGALGAAAGLVAGLGAGFLDPVNLASAYFPLVNQQRMAHMLRNAGGAWARAGIRAGVGAASGAAGSLLLEPTIYFGQQQLQADYTLYNSLMNIGFGAAMGGAMHSGGGAFSDWRRARKGLLPSYAYIPEDLEASREWRDSLADDIYRTRLDANPLADADSILKQAQGEADLFQAAARSWAITNERPVKEYYDRYRQEYRSWRDIETDGWRDAVPDEWRFPGSEVGDELKDLGYLGPEYAGMRQMNADAMTMRQFLEAVDEWQRRFPDLVDYDGILAKIQQIQHEQLFNWRNGVPRQMRNGGKPGEPQQDLGWIGPEYAGLTRLDADAVDLPQFMALLGEWEKRFPEMFDYEGIRRGIEAARQGAGENTLFAMYEDPEKDFLKFMEKGRNKKPGQKQSYYKLDIEGAPEGIAIRVISDMAKHQRNRHMTGDLARDMTVDDNARFPRIIDGINGQNTFATGELGAFGWRHKGSQTIDGVTYGYIFDVRPNAVTFITYFKDYPKGMEGWLKDGRQKKASKARRGNEQSKSLNSATLLGKPIDSIADFVEAVKRINNTDTLFQSSPTSTLPGRATQILGDGFKEPAHYEVREMDGIISSHDPDNQFQKRPGYPEKAQERPYHSDPGEQQKVIKNALAYDPAYVISTDATASNGPPIITQDGIVLGGNSRTMTLQRVYSAFPEKASAYRQALMDNAAQFGIDPQAVAGMKRPMLVRVIEQKLTPEQMAKKSREYNQSLTQQLQGEAEGISRPRFVDRATIDVLLREMNQDKTVAQILAGPESADLALALRDAGVFQDTEMAAMTVRGSSGKLNDAGKARVMQVLRGLVLPDYEVMTGLPKGVLDRLDEAIPALALSRFRGEGWDLTGAFYEAMRFVAMANKEKTPIENLFFQHALGGVDPYRDNPVVQALAMTFAKADTREIRARMDHYIALADTKNAGQNSLIPGMGSTPEKAFREAFLEPLAIAGDRRIANFRPDSNPQHAAIQWASDYAGKSGKVSTAIEKLEKALDRKKITPVEKAQLQAVYNEIGKLEPESSVIVRQPKLSEYFTAPEKLDIPAPKKPGEKGALPDATVVEDRLDLNDPDALQPPELQENPAQNRIIRGMVTFSANERPIVTLFREANATTGFHEMFHVFRRQLEDTARDPNASSHAREQWRAACEFVGAKEGERWTRKMEEKFAEGGIRYLSEGKAPSSGLAALFERIKQWFMDIFQRADEAGVEISPAMRKAFDDMFTTPYEVGDRNFRRAIGEIATRNPAREFTNQETTGGRFSPEDTALLDAEKRGDVELAQTLLQEAQARAEELYGNLEGRDPKLAAEIMDDGARAQLEADEAAIRHVDEREEFLRQALECRMNGG